MILELYSCNFTIGRDGYVIFVIESEYMVKYVHFSLPSPTLFGGMGGGGLPLRAFPLICNHKYNHIDYFICYLWWIYNKLLEGIDFNFWDKRAMHSMILILMFQRMYRGSSLDYGMFVIYKPSDSFKVRRIFCKKCFFSVINERV